MGGFEAVAVYFRAAMPDLDPESPILDYGPAPRHPRLRRWVNRAGLVLLTLVVILGGTFGWLYWGWHDETAALAQLGPGLLNNMTQPLIPKEWADRLPDRIGWVVQRVSDIRLNARSDADLAALHRLQRIRSLVLVYPALTEQQTEDLAQFPRLETLLLFNCTLTDRGLASLSRCPKLEDLRLIDVQLSDQSLAALGTFPSLRRLWIRNTPITDAGLKHLEGLTKLTEIYLMGSITAEGAIRLKKALPNTSIIGPDYIEVTLPPK